MCNNIILGVIMDMQKCDSKELNVGFVNFDETDFRGLKSVQILRHVITGTDDNVEFIDYLADNTYVLIQDTGVIRNAYIAYDPTVRARTVDLIKPNPGAIRFFRFAVIIGFENGSRLICEESDGLIISKERRRFELRHLTSDMHIAKLCFGEVGKVTISGQMWNGCIGETLTIMAIDDESIVITSTSSD